MISAANSSLPSQRRQRRLRLAGDGGVAAREQPRVAEAAAADHCQIGAGVAQDVRRVCAGKNVAVGDDGDRHGALDVADDVPVGAAGIHLHARAPVHGDGGRARLLAHLRKGHGVDVSAVPALAEFHGHGHIDGLDDRLDDSPGELGIAHERRTVAAADDLAHRAAHIDIQNVRTGVCQRHGRGLGHDLRLVAEDLHGGGVLVRRRPEQLLRFFIVIDQRLGAHHFRAGEGGALRAAQRAKRRIGHARHGRERERAADLDVSDLHHAISSSTGQWSLP